MLLARLRCYAGLAAAALLAAGPGAAAPPARPALVGFYDGWDPAARPGLERKLEALDIFAPRWITVRGASAQVVSEPDEGLPAAIARLKRRPLVMPMVSNAHDDIWDQASAGAVILDPAARAAFARRLADLARTGGYAGYVLDFENMTPQAQAAYPALIAALHKALAPSGIKVWATSLVGSDQLAALAASADAVVLMAYDECWASSTPGPIAGRDWLAGVLSSRMAGPSGLDPRRTAVALASYGYDWPRGGRAEPVSVPAARALAARSGARIRRDTASGNLWFSYSPASGPPHQVWFVDAEAFAAQTHVAAAFGVRAVALWRIGLEDPGIWTAPPQGPAGPLPKPSVGAPLPHPCDPLKKAP
jgi:spore germination protein YaaH